MGFIVVVVFSQHINKRKKKTACDTEQFTQCRETEVTGNNRDISEAYNQSCRITSLELWASSCSRQHIFDFLKLVLIYGCYGILNKL